MNLDADTQQRLTRIARLVRLSLGIPITYFSVLNSPHDWYLNHPGLATPLTDVLVLPKQVLAHNAALWQTDSAPDAQSVYHYAGLPIRSDQGQCLAVMSLAGYEPRHFSESEQLLLQDLATSAETELSHARLQLESKQKAFLALMSEYKLQQHENRFHAIIDTVIDGVISVNAEGFIEASNISAQALFGYVDYELNNKPLGLLLAPIDYYVAEPDFLRQLARTPKTSHLANIDAHGMRKGGTLFPLQIRASEVLIADEPVFIVVIHDLSETRLMELAFKRFDAIIRYSDDAIVSKDLNGIITSWNEGAEKIFGYSATEIIGKPALILYPADREHEEQQAAKKLVSGEKAEHLETVRIHKNGTPVDISVTISPIIDEDGNTIGISNIARDITERKQLERLKSEFISTVSHELRTPLTSIRGALDLVLGKSAEHLPDKARKMLEMAARNSERLTLLINDILDLEKIESGKIEFDFKQADLIALAQRAVDDNLGYALKHRVQLRLTLTGLSEAPVYVDENRLLQVFANLMSNAIKFSPEDSHVEIRVEPHKAGYRINVCDQGSGIPEEFRNRIFQRFAQADSSDTRQKGGTGLGLSISKAIIERHHGQLNFISELGQGTQFFFDLPAHAAPLAQSSNYSEQELAPVLICEDNPDVADILAEMLKNEGIFCHIAATLAAARALLKQKHYELLLLDLALPDGNGLQLVEELRAIPATQQLPVIVISGRALENINAFTGSAMTIVDWLQKPFDHERLKTAVQHVLSNTERPTILHVEDDVDIVQIIKALLEDISHYQQAASIADTRQLLASRHYDLVILDLGLEDGSGLDLLDDLKNHCPVIIFSAQTIDHEVSTKVSAALTKSMTSNEQLIQTIQKLLHKSLT